ncbi:MAG: DUF4159 domain-containing protein [Paracoccaceae bacterium]
MIAFVYPFLLFALLALPVLWLLLRATPPAPVRRPFAAVRLLLGLKDPENTPARTPWWLLLLRLTALAAAIIGFAAPVLNPKTEATGSGPLLVVMDASWASAPDWTARSQRLEAVLNEAARAGRPTALHLLTSPIPASPLEFGVAQDLLATLTGLAPAPYAPNRAAWAEWLGDAAGFDTVWFTDALGEDGGLGAVLTAAGSLQIVMPDAPAFALLPPGLDETGLIQPVIRASAGSAFTANLVAYGPAPGGAEVALWRASAEFAADDTAAAALFDMPLELRNRISRIALAGHASAGTVALADDGLRRRKVGLLTTSSASETPPLVSPHYYLTNALGPSAELTEADMPALMATAPDVIVLADIATLPEAEAAGLQAWVEAGGTLLRFAGPRVAQAAAEQMEANPLLPVHLRAGGRALGGAMTWAEPRALGDWPENSPFAGLTVPADVTVTAQVLAQPDPDLPSKVIAQLADGTPLVTWSRLGRGRLVLFHVTANAEWSDLPLSGLFVEMLERLAIGAGGQGATAADLAGQTWLPVATLDGFGHLGQPTLAMAVDGAVLSDSPRDITTPPGLYESAAGRQVAINLFGPEATLSTLPLPASATRINLADEPPQPLGHLLLMAALCLLILDILAATFVSGRLIGGRVAALALAALLASQPHSADAQDQPYDAQIAATETVLAYVITGDARTDRASAAALYGLSRILFDRTSIEPAAPMGIDPNSEDITFFPFLYWPVTPSHPALSETAITRLNAYLRNGGMIMFDTQDAHLGQNTENARMLQRIAADLDIPALAPIEPDHVLGRSFYLLETYPGRWYDGTLWVEAPVNLTAIDGSPFRNLNDGVTPVVITGNDFAAAWAMGEDGRPLFPVGAGMAGERQREIARRVGVNLIMYVMTGNYKSDQVHVPALLERLGQ